MKTYQIRDMSANDLMLSLKDNYEALENLRFQQATNQLENYKAVSNTKKNIAKIKTILKEKDLKINENFTKNKK